MSNKHISNIISSLLKNVLSAKGEELSEIIINWRQIVGESLSLYTIPIKIKQYKTRYGRSASLIIQCTKDANLLEVKFSESLITQRINNYFGYNLITKIEIK